MTSFADVQNAIRAGIVTLSGLHDSAVFWSDNAHHAGNMLVVLDIVYSVDLGSRECLKPNALDPTKYDWTLTNLYQLRIQIRVESTYNQPGYDAMLVLHRIQAGLRRRDLDWGLGKDLSVQPDINTYNHHVSGPHDTTTINAHAFETNFNAVVDFPADAPLDAGPNMTAVILDETEIEIGEASPVDIDQTIARP